MKDKVKDTYTLRALLIKSDYDSTELTISSSFNARGFEVFKVEFRDYQKGEQVFIGEFERFAVSACSPGGAMVNIFESYCSSGREVLIESLKKSLCLNRLKNKFHDFKVKKMWEKYTEKTQRNFFSTKPKYCTIQPQPIL